MSNIRHFGTITQKDSYLSTMSCDVPANILDINLQNSDMMNQKILKKLITCLCTMTGFASIATIEKTTYKTVISRH